MTEDAASLTNYSFATSWRLKHMIAHSKSQSCDLRARSRCGDSYHINLETSGAGLCFDGVDEREGGEGKVM